MLDLECFQHCLAHHQFDNVILRTDTVFECARVKNKRATLRKIPIVRTKRTREIEKNSNSMKKIPRYSSLRAISFHFFIIHLKMFYQQVVNVMPFYLLEFIFVLCVFVFLSFFLHVLLLSAVQKNTTFTLETKWYTMTERTNMVMIFSWYKQTIAMSKAPLDICKTR